MIVVQILLHGAIGFIKNTTQRLLFILLLFYFIQFYFYFLNLNWTISICEEEGWVADPTLSSSRSKKNTVTFFGGIYRINILRGNRDRKGSFRSCYQWNNL